MFQALMAVSPADSPVNWAKYLLLNSQHYQLSGTLDLRIRRNVMNSQTTLLSERHKLKSRKMSEQQKFLRLSPVNHAKPTAKKSLKTPKLNGQVAPKTPSFRLPYSNILTTQDKAPRIEVLEVSCGSCGHIGSVYKHRTEKGMCVKCGRPYKNFKVYNKFSSGEVRDMLARKS